MRVYIFFMSALLPGTFVFQAACVPPLNSWTHHHSIFLLVVTEVAWGQLFPQQLTKSLDEEESDIVPWTTRPPASSPCPPGWEAGRLSLLGAQRGSGGGVCGSAWVTYGKWRKYLYSWGQSRRSKEGHTREISSRRQTHRLDTLVWTRQRI